MRSPGAGAAAQGATQEEDLLSADRIHPRTRAGDPFAAAASNRRFASYELELLEAIREDEARQGRTMAPGEREAFARGFFGPEYAAEIRLLAASGHLDEEDGEA